MKTLLEYFLRNFDFLYLDPSYRITDSSNAGIATINASLTLTGPVLSWQIANDRGQMLIDVAPSRMKAPENWFRVPIIRQHLDHVDERNITQPDETVVWIRENLSRIEDLFSDASVAESCDSLKNLEEANATRYWGPPTP